MPSDLDKLRVNWKSTEKYDFPLFIQINKRFLRHER